MGASGVGRPHQSPPAMHRRLAWALSVAVSAVFLASLLAAGPAVARTVILDGFPPLTQVEGGEPEPDLVAPEVYPGPDEIPGVMAAGGPPPAPEGGAGSMSGVPAYVWRHGCGPTSAGMVLGYWDGHGFPDLVPGDAGSQTASVDAMVASTEHYNDYGVPRDDSGAILADKSQLGGAHASNCVADFIHTSWSSDSLRYGWSMVTTSTSATYGISYGMEAYALLANAAYGSSSLSQRVDTNITAGWTAFVAEIDAGRPTVFLVDTEGDALTDHMVAVFGYEQTGGKNYYICYNTWDTAVHKYEYRARASGVTWGVAYASYFLPTLYSISGTVTSGGSGLGGVLVDAGGHSATTASDGTYTISGLPPTTYTVTPSKTDFVFSPASLSVTVGPNASGKDFAATSTLTYSISGQVTSSGSPLSGVIVDAGGGHSATTAADGTYAIAGLTPATYTVTPSKSEYTFSPASLSVTVGPNATGKDFAATQNTYTVTGTITSGGSGLPGVTVAAGSATTTTAADGTYTIAGLAAAAYTVTPSKTEYVFSPASLSVTVGPSASGKDFAATQETYTISGAVTSGGSGLSGVVVSAGGASATTGSNGIYTITGLIAGDYSVTPSKAEYTFTPPSLSVSLGPNASGNDFAATQNTYGISGTIATDGGTPVGGVYVDAGGGHTDTTASDGTYAIGDLVAGTYTVTPSASGYTFGPVSLSVTVGPDATGQGFEATQDPGTFSVSGTVTVGGAGLPQVLVDAGGGFTTSTGANGAYTISGLPAGLYTLTPSKAEYSFSPVSISVNVGGQGDLTGKDFAATQNTYAISGTIAVGGVGLASVTVAAGGQSATTDADGKFSITGLVAGTYTVTPARAEHSFSPASTSVTVGPSATGKDFTATQNTYAVSGTVTFGGSGLSGVQVTAGGSSATTGADGKYSIAGLTAGSYTVTAAKAPYTFSPGSRGVTVGPSAAGADFTADRTYAVSGSVTLGGSGLPGVTVSAGGQTATTAADGTYTISGLTAGTYTVTPSRSEYAFSPTTQPATVGPDAAGLDFAAAQVTYSIAGSAKVGDVGLAGVSISAGGSTTTTAADGTFTISGLAAGSYTVTPSLGEYTFSPSSLSVTLGPNATGQAFTATQKTYTISGTVAAGGVGVSGVTVATGGKSVTTTDSGAYSITGLVAGTYTVTASKAGYVTTPASLAVTVGPDATGRSFAAAPTYGISGSITAGGRGLGGVTVSVGGQSCITAADGTYSLSGLVAGGYTITPSKAEYGFLPASLPVTVGPSTTGRDFTATQNTYTIAGTISSGGSGLPGVAVSAGGQSAVTGSNGSYTISGLVAGEYVVTPSKAEYTFSPASMSAALGPNATGVNCTATRRTYTISGRVTGSSGRHRPGRGGNRDDSDGWHLRLLRPRVGRLHGHPVEERLCLWASLQERHDRARRNEPGFRRRGRLQPHVAQRLVDALCASVRGDWLHRRHPWGSRAQRRYVGPDHRAVRVVERPSRSGRRLLDQASALGRSGRGRHARSGRQPHSSPEGWLADGWQPVPRRHRLAKHLRPIGRQYGISVPGCRQRVGSLLWLGIRPGQLELPTRT